MIEYSNAEDARAEKRFAEEEERVDFFGGAVLKADNAEAPSRRKTPADEPRD